MRGIYNPITELRRKVFTEIARLAYEGGDYNRIEDLPYKIIPGEVETYRNSIFLERAIVGERLRLAIGLPLRPIDKHAPVSKGINESAIAKKYYDPPLINVIKFACNKCDENKVMVTNGCRGCLAHTCSCVCPTNAISIVNSKSVIDQDKCIKCGKCIEACPYNAIIRTKRPCAEACGVDAIKSDELGRAEIDYEKCVSCGMCLVNCPFGAIADKGQIFQLIHAMKSKKKVIAAVAPSFVSQFGDNVSPNKVFSAMKKLGFHDVVEVAIGADLCSIEEAYDFLDKVPNKQPFMATSCCPSWSVMAKNEFKEFKSYISMALTPMVLTARLIKKENKDANIAFIGPCVSKKLEASRKSVRSDVDFVLTFEEIMGMFKAKGIDFNELKDEDMKEEASRDGRGYAVSGGVAKAVADCIKKIDKDREIKIDKADSLRDCKKMLMLAKAGKRDGYLLEGMACPGGCVAGTGTLQNIKKATAEVEKFANDAKDKYPYDSKYKDDIEDLFE